MLSLGTGDLGDFSTRSGIPIGAAPRSESFGCVIARICAFQSSVTVDSECSQAFVVGNSFSTGSTSVGL